MIHARNLSSGTVALENTHPFKEKLNSTEYVFCQNGSIDKQDWIKFKEHFKPKGNADTERLFSHLLSGEISKKGIEKSLSVFKKYTALNFILARKDKVFFATWLKEKPRYYQMKILELPNITIISSEVLKSFGKKSDWKKLENKKVFEKNF